MLIETRRSNGVAARIVYSTAAAVDCYDLERLCDDVGWPRRPINKVKAALENSFCVASLYLELEEAPKETNEATETNDDADDAFAGVANASATGGLPGVSYPPEPSPSAVTGAGTGERRLIGMARATSDHAFNATIWDVVLAPEFQGRGWGRRSASSSFARCSRATSETSRSSLTAPSCPSTRTWASSPTRRGSKACSCTPSGGKCRRRATRARRLSRCVKCPTV